MTKHEAKTILHACQDPNQGLEDPLIAEALAFAERDPELREWFKEWQSVDRILSEKLKAAPLPEMVLEEGAARARFQLARRRSNLVLSFGLAACVFLVGFLGALWLRPSPSGGEMEALVAVRSDMAVLLNEFPRLDLRTDRLEEAAQWLADHHPSTPASWPAALKSFPTIGCRTLEWRGREVALVCFMVDGEVVHFLLFSSAEFPELMGSANPQYSTAGRFYTATWESDETFYLSMTAGGEPFLRNLL